MGSKQYKVLYTYSSRNDIRAMKKYILDTFKYHELGESFTKKIKDAVKGLKLLPSGHNNTGFQYREFDIFLKPYRTYLLFYIIDEKEQVVTILRVLQDGMNWEYILKHWLKGNK